jgi:uncharacterized membrane protein
VRRETWIAAAVFGAVPLLIVSGAVACTSAIAHGASMKWRLLFRLFCHGIPSHCLSLWGVPMPICARCTAIYVGLFSGLMLFLAIPWVQERWLRVAVWIALLPMAVDGTTQLLRLRDSTNPLRVATGATAGIVFGMWVLSVIERREKALFTSS